MRARISQGVFLRAQVTIDTNTLIIEIIKAKIEKNNAAMKPYLEYIS